MKTLKSGLPIIFPTDTLPAIGCLPKFSNVIYEIKKRDRDKPLILMGSEHEQLIDYVHESAKKDYENIASNNFKISSKQSNLKFYCGNWWSPLESFKGKLDLAISNPPYIPRDTYEKLPKEVKNFEPKVALLGGEDGLKHIREIIHKAPLFLKENGWLILENHFDQSEKVKQLLIKNKFTSIEIVKDLSGIGRFTIGRYK